MLEELIGADSETNSSENFPKSTPSNGLEQIATSESTDIAETLMKSVSDSARLGLHLPPGNKETRGQLAVVPSPNKEVSLEASEPGIQTVVPKLAIAVSPSVEEQISSELKPAALPSAKLEGDIGVRHLVPQFQNQRLVFVRSSPDGRGWPEGPGEGYKTNHSLSGFGHPLSSGEELPPQEGDSDVTRLVPQPPPANEPTSEQSPVFSQLAPNNGAPASADIQNQKSVLELFSKGTILHPSPGPSGHPLPSGEGLPQRFKQATAAESVAEDPTLLISNLDPVAIAPAHSTKPENLIPETGAPIDVTEKRIPERLNLADFGVTRFEYKTETEPHLSPVLQSAQMLQMMRSSPPIREIKPVKPAPSFDTLMQNASSQAEASTRPAVLTRPDEVQHVRLVFEPPPPPPVVRSVSMDIGDPDSQVRVVIRERNGSLNVQVGTTNERLREDLQVASPMLMRELQRNNPMSVTLDFSNFGSATDADSQSRSQARAKKLLKPDAEFADVVETAYLPAPSTELKPL